MTVTNGIRKRRSRNGCLSCKQLRIKCDESKPQCEYCTHTKRQCFYPTLKPLKKDSKNQEIVEINNSSKYRHQDVLTRNLILTQASSMLNITKFELRLLNFFDSQCINLFSYGVNQGIHDAWKYKVPYLFLQSDLVRQSMFSFAALGLSTTFELDILQDLDSSSQDNNQELYKFDVSDKHNLFLSTTKYFLNVLGKSRDLINFQNLPMIKQDPQLAKELTVSSILIFAFLGVHPHKIVPLISFNDDGEEQADLISVAKGIRYTLMECSEVILKSDIGGLLFYHETDKMKPPSITKCQYPVIKNLMDQWNLINDHETSVIDRKGIVIEEAIDMLVKGMYNVSFYKFPVPLYRWLMMLSDDFRNMLYEKEPFCLKLLFVYSTLSSIARFQFYNDNNIWRDFMIWYKENYDLNEMEFQLFYLCVEKHFMIENFETFPNFNPSEEYRKLI